MCSAAAISLTLSTTGQAGRCADARRHRARSHQRRRRRRLAPLLRRAVRVGVPRVRAGLPPRRAPGRARGRRPAAPRPAPGRPDHRPGGHVRGRRRRRRGRRGRGERRADPDGEGRDPRRRRAHLLRRPGRERGRSHPLPVASVRRRRGRGTMVRRTAMAAISVALATTAPAQAAPVTRVFTYTGDVQTLQLPEGVGTVSVLADGAAGGNGLILGAGGFGGRVSAQLDVPAGGLLYVMAGGRGTKGIGGDPATAGGFNGGGSGNNAGGSGGGASDVRLDWPGAPDSLGPRLGGAGAGRG